MQRLVVIRLHDLYTCVAKAADSPVVSILRFTDPLSEPQLRILSLATPFAPVVVTANVSDDWVCGAWRAELVTVESPVKMPVVSKKRKIRAGVAVRKRGGVMLPE